jgi:hypothetical protein
MFSMDAFGCLIVLIWIKNLFISIGMHIIGWLGIMYTKWTSSFQIHLMESGIAYVQKCISSGCITQTIMYWRPVGDSYRHMAIVTAAFSATARNLVAG